MDRKLPFHPASNLKAPFLPNKARALQLSTHPAPTSLHTGTAREAEKARNRPLCRPQKVVTFTSPLVDFSENGMGGGKFFLFRDNLSCSLDLTCSEIVLSKFTKSSHLVFAHLPSKEGGGEASVKGQREIQSLRGEFCCPAPLRPRSPSRGVANLISKPPPLSACHLTSALLILSLARTF